MLGFWDYTVILTYLSFASGGIGIFLAASMQLKWAVFCLACSGLLDMFDGKVARTKKNRTADEKNFGIQIDSLCDLVCFGVLPMMICYQSGMRRRFSMAVLVLYGLAGLVRLAYFNVMEEKRQAVTEADKEYYQGLPITSMAIALPILFLFAPMFLNHIQFLTIMHLLVMIVGAMFIVDFKLKKLTAMKMILLVFVVVLIMLTLIFVAKILGGGIFRRVKESDRNRFQADMGSHCLYDYERFMEPVSCQTVYEGLFKDCFSQDISLDRIPGSCLKVFVFSRRDSA